MGKGLFFLVGLTSLVVCASIRMNLTMVLATDEGPLNGPYDVTLSLVSPDKTQWWSEHHASIMVFDGAMAFLFGQQSPIQSDWFANGNLQLAVTIANQTVYLPLYTTPFVVESMGADIVNKVHMEGVFHMEPLTQRVGIGLSIPTPATRLDVGGAVRVGDSTVTLPGMIRWRNNRLEGRHRFNWQMLDINNADDLHSKWLEADHGLGIYSLSPVAIQATQPTNAMLTVGGDMHVTKQAHSSNWYMNALSLADGLYGVDSNQTLVGQSISVGSNTFDSINGLVVTGAFIGDASGLTNLNPTHVVSNSISGNAIASQSILSGHLNDPVPGSKIAMGELSAAHLSNTVGLTNEMIANQTITGDHILAGALEDRHLLGGTSAFPSLSMANHAIASVNIGSQDITSRNIANGGIQLSDVSFGAINHTHLIATNSIQSHHIHPGSISLDNIASGSIQFNHFKGGFLFENGGTNQNAYTAVHAAVVVSGNQFVSDATVKITDAGVGIHVEDPQGQLHVSTNARALHILGDKSAMLALKSANADWRFGLTNNEVALVGQQYDRRAFTISTDGRVGVSGGLGTQSLHVSGAVVVGSHYNQSPPDGTIWFSHGEFYYQSPSGGVALNAIGGMYIVSKNITLAALLPNSGSWSHVSDGALKTNIQSIDANTMLRKVATIPISEWIYKGQPFVFHVGPMAQDFYRLFQLGASDRYIQHVDIDGVILSSIQALGHGLTTIKDEKQILDVNRYTSHQQSARMSDALVQIHADLSDIQAMDARLNRRFKQHMDHQRQQRRQLEQSTLFLEDWLRSNKDLK